MAGVMERPAVAPKPEVIPQPSSPSSPDKGPGILRRAGNWARAKFGREQQANAPTPEAALRVIAEAPSNQTVNQDAVFAKDYLAGKITLEQARVLGYTDAELVNLNQQGIIAENSNTKQDSVSVLEPVAATEASKEVDQPVQENKQPKTVKDIQKQVATEYYGQWKDKWVGQTMHDYVERGQVLPDTFVNDPAYQEVFEAQTNKAFLEGQGSNRALIMEKTFGKYRDAKDATFVNPGENVQKQLPDDLKTDTEFNQQVVKRLMETNGIVQGLPKELAKDPEFMEELGKKLSTTDEDITFEELQKQVFETEQFDKWRTTDLSSAMHTAHIEQGKPSDTDTAEKRYNKWRNNWIDTVYKAHIEEGKPLDQRNVDARYAIPQAEGMREDPLYQKAFAEATKYAQQRGDVNNKAAIFKNTLGRYRTAKDADLIASFAEQHPSVTKEAGKEGTPPIDGEVREAVTQRVAAAGGTTTEGVDKITAEEIAASNKRAYDEITNLGLSIGADETVEGLMAQLATPERGWKNDEATQKYIAQAIEHARAEKAKQDAANAEASINVSEVAQGKEQTPEKQIQVLREQVVKLTQQNEQLLKVVKDALPALLKDAADKEPDPQKKQQYTNLWMLVMALIGGATQGIESSVSE